MTREELEDDFPFSAGVLRAKYEYEHPYFQRGDWVQEVTNDDTILGYWDWVVAKLMEELDND